jgi:hypothetical protein
MKTEDLRITCVDCGKDFIIESHEQEFYKEKGLYLPKRCPACRLKRKQGGQYGR